MLGKIQKLQSEINYLKELHNQIVLISKTITNDNNNNYDIESLFDCLPSKIVNGYIDCDSFIHHGSDCKCSYCDEYKEIFIIVTLAINKAKENNKSIKDLQIYDLIKSNLNL